MTRLKYLCSPLDGTSLASQRAWSLVLVILLAPVFSASARAQTLTVGRADSVRYLDSVKTLTAPAMEGRGDGTEGLTRAAQFLEESYKRLGLQTAGTQGYLQPFNVVTGGTLGQQNSLHQQMGNEEKTFQVNEDFVPFSFSSSGQVSGSLVCAGYGVTAPEFGYDDYSEIDVRDKIVVLLRYEPPSFVEESASHNFTRHAALI